MKTVRACNVHIKIPIRPERIISLVLRGQQMMKFMHWILDDTQLPQKCKQIKTSTFRAKALRCVRSSQRGSKTKYAYVLLDREYKSDQVTKNRPISVVKTN